MTSEQILFALLRSELTGAPVEGIKDSCTPQLLEQVYTLAARHKLAHIVGQAVSKLGLPENASFLWCRDQAQRAFLRHMRFSTDFERICNLFESEKIPYIPMKGAVLRDSYPEPWMRTSCDIDILVERENLERAAAAIREKLQFTGGELCSDHDVTLISPMGIKLELHYDTVPDSYAVNRSRQVLSRMWKDVIPAGADSYRRNMTDEMFYFYHIAHLAKHIKNGGCGIKAFMDTWVLQYRVAHDTQARRQLLAEGGLLAVAEAVERLTDVWFCGKETDEMIEKFGKYILAGGVFGTLENSVAIRQVKQGGKVAYVLHRVFLPYETLKFDYPVLQKHKWLLPVYQVVRWSKILFRGGIKHSVRELQVSAAVSREEEQAAQNLLQYLNIQ